MNGPRYFGPTQKAQLRDWPNNNPTGRNPNYAPHRRPYKVFRTFQYKQNSLPISTSMDPPPRTTASSAAAATAAPQSSDSLQSSLTQAQAHQPPSPLPPPSSAAPLSTPSPSPPLSSSPNPMSSQSMPTSSQSLSRPWQQQQQPPPSAPGPLSQRGGIAIGVPAHHNNPAPQSSPFSSPFMGQHYGGLGRGAVNSPESISSTNSPQMRPSMQGMHGVGMLGSGSQMRPGGIHQQRPLQQSSLRPPPSSTSQSPSSQSFAGHGLLRGSSVGSSLSPSPSTSQGMPSPTQPWLSSASQGKPPVPSPSFRPPTNSQSSLQQRSHIPQQHHPSPPASTQQQQTPSALSQPSSQSTQSQEHFGLLPSRVQPSLPPQPTPRFPGAATQKPSSLTIGQAQPNSLASAMNGKIVAAESDESCTRIISKRSINELLNQIDPSEKMDPDVEDVLMDIAEEFVESITTFGCSLAKHRKSSTLEAKDILLHLERNWNMTLPGFSGDEVKSFKKPVTNDIHRERLAVIKKSAAVAEASSNRGAAGQVAGSAKSNLAKTPANVLGSPNMKS